MVEKLKWLIFACLFNFTFNSTAQNISQIPTLLSIDSLFDHTVISPHSTLSQWYAANTGNAPFQARPDIWNGGGCWEMYAKDDVVYIGMSTGGPWNANGASLFKYELSSNTLTFLGNLDEQGITEIEMLADGSLLIASDDPAYGDSWDAGNLYTYNDIDGLTKIRYNEPVKRLIATTTTDANGDYQFTDIKATFYEVKFIPPTGYQLSPSDLSNADNIRRVGQATDQLSDPQTSTGIVHVAGPNGGPYFDPAATNRYGQGGDSPHVDFSTTKIDAGLVAGTSTLSNSNAIADTTNFSGNTTIGGTVWIDTNGDSALDAGETGMANVTVEIYSKDPVFPCALHAQDIFVDPVTNYIYYHTYWNTAYISKDNGQTWKDYLRYETDVHLTGSAWSSYVFNNAIYTKARYWDANDVQFLNLMKSTDEGETWSIVGNINPFYSNEMVTFNNELLVLSNTALDYYTPLQNKIATVDANDIITEYDFPAGYNYEYNHYEITKAIGNHLYVLLYNAQNQIEILRTVDLVNWQTVFIEDQNRAITHMEYWEQENKLLLGEAGDSVHIWSLNLDDIIPIAPVANLTASSISGLEDLTVTFDGSSSTDIDGLIVQYDWDFGDGNSNSTINPMHIYTSPGIYTATLTITDETGLSDQSNIQIEVIDCTINLSAVWVDETVAGQNDGVINLAVTGGTAPYNYFWSNNANSQDINNLAPGIYAVNVVDANNCSNSYSVNIGAGVPACVVPNSIAASNIQNTSATISWNLDQNVDSYQVEYRIVGANSWTTFSSNFAFAILNNLNTCEEYEVRLKSNCPTGLNSGYSTIYNFETTGCVLPCSSINGLFSQNVTNSSAFLVWDIVPNATYTMYYRAVGNATWFSYPTQYPIAILFTLPACVDFEWYVEVNCSNGQISASSPIANFSTLGAACKSQTFEFGNANETDALFSIYPNPANDYLNVLFEKDIKHNSRVVIYDALGKIIWSDKVLSSSTQQTINVEDFAAGIYHIAVINDEQISSLSFIINRE